MKFIAYIHHISTKISCLPLMSHLLRIIFLVEYKNTNIIIFVAFYRIVYLPHDSINMNISAQSAVHCFEKRKYSLLYNF